MAPSWRLLLDLDGRPGWQNMGLDLALLARAGCGERWLRLYRWSPHCLSFGRHEPALRRYDRSRIEARGLDVVRRPTGGRAVWHAEELTYAVAAPAEPFGGLRQAYQEIHRMVLDALRRLGVAAELASPRAGVALDAGACFASPVGGEITVAGRKLVGSAQLREGAALLQHGSLLLAGCQSTVQEVTRGVPPADLAVPLGDVAGGLSDPAPVAEALAGAASERWSGAWERWSPDHSLLAEASSHGERFRSPDWTWRA
jgi:lipoyl(octanoyl) transferase